jgi:hypothetical protein
VLFIPRVYKLVALGALGLIVMAVLLALSRSSPLPDSAARGEAEEQPPTGRAG